MMHMCVNMQCIDWGHLQLYNKPTLFLVTGFWLGLQSDNVDKYLWMDDMKWLRLPAVAAASSSSVAWSCPPGSLRWYCLMSVSLQFCSVLMWACSVRKIIGGHLRKEARECGWDHAAAHSKAIWGRMYQSPAELSNQFSPLWGQRGQDGGTHLGNECPSMLFIADEKEEGFLLLLLSLQHLIVSSFWVWGFWPPWVLLLFMVVFVIAVLHVCISLDAGLHVQGNLPLPLELKR